MEPTVADLSQRLSEINQRIAHAARLSGRTQSDVTLIAVTKTHPVEVIREAYHLGLRHFGENRVEEGEEKIRALSVDCPEAVWHMIGHLQSRKSSAAAEYFNWIHSLDRLKIANRLSAAAQDQGQILTCLVQVNVSGEESKSGFDLRAWQSDRAKYDRFVQQIGEMLQLGGLMLDGLMTMAPYATDPELARPVFRDLRLLRDALRSEYPSQPWTHLSMGMSGDFEVAVEEGATLVRIGTSLFGVRGT